MPIKKRLVFFAVVYSTITIWFIRDSQAHEHGGELYFLIFPWFWAFGGLALWLIKGFTVSSRKGKLNKLLLLICTPVPALVFFLGAYVWLTQFAFRNTAHYYTKDSFKVKEVDYQFQKRKIYFSNYDTRDSGYLLDSVIRYDSDSGKYVTDKYVGWQRLLQGN